MAIDVYLSMDEEIPKIVPWSETPIVFIKLPPAVRCPDCGSEYTVRARTLSGGDGSYCRRLTCVECMTRFRGVYEP